MSIFNSAPKSGGTSSLPSTSNARLTVCWVLAFMGHFGAAVLKLSVCDVLDESGQDDGAAKANPSLTREKDLVVNISDLDNIFDEDEEELGVSRRGLRTIFSFSVFARERREKRKLTFF